MPHLRIKNLPYQSLVKAVPPLIEKLATLCQSDVADFTVECVEHQTVPVVLDAIVTLDPLIEVGWFKRSEEVQHQVAQELDKFLNQMGDFSYRTVIFLEYDRANYYENGRSF